MITPIEVIVALGLVGVVVGLVLYESGRPKGCLIAKLSLLVIVVVLVVAVVWFEVFSP